MISLIKLFLVLVTVTAFIFSWLTGQLGDPRRILLLAILASFTMLVFLLLNLLDNREKRKQRKKQEARSQPRAKGPVQKRSDTSFQLRDRKAGLTWGGGNIKASEATRGTKRKFLGR